MTTVQKMKFSIKDFFIKCDQIRWKLRIWSHLLQKYLMGNFIFCAVDLICFLMLCRTTKIARYSEEYLNSKKVWTHLIFGEKNIMSVIPIY